MTLCPSSQLAIAQDVESPKDDIAAQIRAQGYACDQPQSATRDSQASKPDEEVWLLRCEGGVAIGEAAKSRSCNAQAETLRRDVVVVGAGVDQLLGRRLQL